MAERWTILTVLFLARVTMAFQFQAVAALSPVIMDRFGVGLSEIGLLIGLYLSPGIAIAIPGGAIGRRFGDARAVAAGMVLMILGGVLVTVSAAWEAQLAGRLLAGVGGVLLNVLMSKMITDWFAGRELATAMGIFVNSWPVGIAAALMILPLVEGWAGLQAASALVTLLVVLGLVLLATGYRAPEEAGQTAAAPGAVRGLTRTALTGVLLAGAIWGLYNAALGMVFGFGPAMLAERGWSVAEASSVTSIAMWLVAVSVPLGGILADRLGRRDAVLAVGLAAFAVVMVVAARTEAALPAFVALGLVGGIAAGPIMSLPSDFLAPGTRAFGMGIFFTLFYAAIFAGPVLAGWLSDAFATAGAAFLFGAALLAVCLGAQTALAALRR